MQTLHYTTDNMIVPPSKVVDLAAYRTGSGEPEPEKRRTRGKTRWAGLIADGCASLAVVVMAVVVSLRVLL